MCRDRNGAARREGVLFFMVIKGLAVAALGVRVDWKIVFDVAQRVEEDKAVKAKGLLISSAGDSENHGGVGLKVPVF